MAPERPLALKRAVEVQAAARVQACSLREVVARAAAQLELAPQGRPAARLEVAGQEPAVPARAVELALALPESRQIVRPVAAAVGKVERRSLARTPTPAAQKSPALNRFSSLFLPPGKHGKRGVDSPALQKQRAGKVPCVGSNASKWTKWNQLQSLA